jgi:hypothetical protein
MEELPDGIYIDMPDNVYFGFDRLGSTDMMKLADIGIGWWWQSRYNKGREEPDRPYLNFGRALHKLLLEGRNAFRESFAVQPTQDNYTRVLTKSDDYREALEQAGLSPKELSKLKVSDLLDLCRIHIRDPAIVAWPNVLQDFDVARGRKASVTAKEYYYLDLMYKIIEEDPGPEADQIRSVLNVDKVWPSLSEVTFLWHDKQGLPRRTRFDKLVPNMTLDLKSISHTHGKSLKYAVPDHIKRMNYDVQVADHHEARKAMYALIAEKGEAAISGGTIEQRAFMLAMVEKAVPFDWVWLFYQVPDGTGRAPILLPVLEDWAGPHHINGFRKMHQAKQTYIRAVAQFGLHTPWREVMPLHYTSEGKPTSLPLSHWGFELEPVPDEDTLHR